MDDEKLSNIISNLEIVNHKLSSLEKEIKPEGKAKQNISDSYLLVKQVINELRNLEVSREIERLSDIDEGSSTGKS